MKSAWVVAEVPMMLAAVVPPALAIAFKVFVAPLLFVRAERTPITNVLMLGVPPLASAATAAIAAVSSVHRGGASALGLVPGMPSVDKMTATTASGRFLCCARAAAT